MIRSVVKRSVEAIGVRSGLAWLVRRLSSHHDIVLAYHNIRPDEEAAAGDASLHLSRSSFGEQLDSLQRTHDVVPLAALIRGDATVGRRPRPRAAITFDDAYRGAVTLGVAELRARSLPATIFVAPGRLGDDEFWWDRYEIGVRSDGEEFRRVALSHYQGREQRIRAWAFDSGIAASDVPAFARSATLAELESAIATTDIELGSHTWSHPNLAALPDELLVEELTRPLAWLRERFGQASRPFLSYPYGLFSDHVERTAAAVGYEAGFAIDGGRLVSPPPASFAIPRLNIPAGVSADGFVLRTSGLLSG